MQPKKKFELFLQAMILGEMLHYNMNGANMAGMGTQDKINAMMRGMKDQSMQFYNMNGAQNRTAFGMDGGLDADTADVMAFLMNNGYFDKKNFNADAMNFNADAMNYNGMSSFGMDNNTLYTNSIAGSQWVKQEIASASLTTFKIRIVYTPVAGSPEPVQVTLFRSSFDTAGTFNGAGNLVYTNAGGDTATVIGLTVPMKTLLGLTETEPFRLSFIRMKPRSITQLDNPIEVTENTQWNSSKTNEINPDIYEDPYQQQALVVDVPFNIIINQKVGFTWSIDPDQTSPGLGMALFIAQTLEPTKALQNQPIVRNLGNGQNANFFVPSAPAYALQNAIATKTIQNIGSNPVLSNLIRPKG